MNIDLLTGTHKGETAIVCGTAGNALNELAEVLEHCPDAFIIAVNDAVQIVEAQYLVSIHSEKMHIFRSRSKNKGIITISPSLPNEKYKAVDHWMSECNSGATSAYAAAKVAIKMGAKRVYLCGCPLDPTQGYEKGVDQSPDVMMMMQRFGHVKPSEPKGAHFMRIQIGRLHKHLEKDNVDPIRSLSGYTAKVFGEPEWRKS